MSKTEGELQSWEEEIAILVAEAMQAGISVWGLKEVMAMPVHGRSAVMAAVTKPFVLKILDVVERQFGTKSSS